MTSHEQPRNLGPAVGGPSAQGSNDVGGHSPGEHRLTGRRRFATGAPLAVALLAVVALTMRAPITAVPPGLGLVRESLHLSPFAAGATTSLPVLCFGVFAFASPFLIRRIGLERTVVALLVPIVAGTFLRSAGSTPAFFAGAVLVGCGVAVGNAVVPAFIRTRFPNSVPRLMGLYSAMIQVSGAMGAVLTVPLAVGAGWGWAAAIGIWGVPATAMLLWWLAIDRTRPAHDAASIAPPTGLWHVARRPLNWGITAYMGLQSLVFYTLLTWLPAQLTDSGLSPATAGALMGMFSLIGLPTSFLTPPHAVSRHAKALVIGAMSLQAGALLVLGTGTVGAIVAVVLLGLTQGVSLSAALTYIAAQPDHSDVPAVSALAQGVGYLVAATGPALVGLVIGDEHRWIPANLTLIGVTLTLLLIGVIVGPRLHRRSDAAAS